MQKLLTALVAGAAALVLATGTAAAQAPPSPTAANGAPVNSVGHVDGSPTAIAQDPSTGTLFIASGPNEETGKGGGIYAVAPGGNTAVPIANTGFGVFGLAFADGTLYASTLASPTSPGTIVAYSQWNGSTFGSSKTIFDAAKTV